MASSVRPSSVYSSASTSYQYATASGADSRPWTNRTSTARPKTRARTAASTVTGDQQLLCAVSESRGLSPVVGLAFLNTFTAEAVLCQISDNQLLERTINKIGVYDPSEVMFMNTSAQPKSKLYSTVETQLDIPIRVADRKYWSESSGLEYIQQLAYKQDVEALKVSLGGNFYATCCLAAVLKYIELQLSFSFSFHSLRIKFEPSEGSMMIDLSTISTMELTQNLLNAKSKHCLYGILNQTSTPMGARLLRSNIMQPLTSVDELEQRYDALQEMTSKEEIFAAIRTALKTFVDVDRVLNAITVIPSKPSIQYREQSINNVIMLKQYVKSIRPIYSALNGAQSAVLSRIGRACEAPQYVEVEELIDNIINSDITYQQKPLELRYQRTFAVKSGVNGLLEVARQTFTEANNDALQLIKELEVQHSLIIETKYDPARKYYVRISVDDLEDGVLPPVFINNIRRKGYIECQTMDLLKCNQKIGDCHDEILNLSDNLVQQLIKDIREEIEPLFHIREAIALLDMLVSFAQVSTTRDYSRPERTDTLAIKDGRHPIREVVQSEKYIPNDAYATRQKRFQIITGCNMSGKSTYMRSLALMAIMSQIGCFVPAAYASFPIYHQLFARVSSDDNLEANVSTFAAEMRETAFIIRNIDSRSMVIIDELGRGTSTRDGLCIAIAIAEALVDSYAQVWFATHFRDLAHILSERPGVVSLHLSVDMKDPAKMIMLYKVANGCVKDENYGIALAKVVGLPQDVIEFAEEVSAKLKEIADSKKMSSKAIAVARRRKLILNLHEQLVQARDGNLDGEPLRVWLKKLQDEFVTRMAALDATISAADDEEVLQEKVSEVSEEDGEIDDGASTLS